MTDTKFPFKKDSNMNYEKIYSELFATGHYSEPAPRKATYYIKYNVFDKIPVNGRIIDIGSGAGLGLDEILVRTSKDKVLTCDLHKFHSYDVPFEKIDLSKPDTYRHLLSKYERFDHLICFDVMEHLEEEYTDDILKFMSEITNTASLAICKNPDFQRGEQLHLNVKPHKWWTDHIAQYFQILEDKEWEPNSPKDIRPIGKCEQYAMSVFYLKSR